MRAQGQRILSELNDFKRTVASCATELGWPEADVQQVIDGDAAPAQVKALIDAMCAMYPVNRADLELGEDDTRHGVKVMKLAESKKTARVFKRRNRNGELTPYYEYRDTATSRLSSFRPEWIKELRVVDDLDPKNPDAIYNNGHFMHQVTFFVGPVNFYYKIGEQYICEEMNTGDSNYITPYFPHSFTARNAEEEAYIVAVTFGGDVRRSLDELYRMGKTRASQYLVNSRNPQQGTQGLIDYHLKNEWLTREHLQAQLDNAGEKINVLESTQAYSPEQLAVLAQFLNVEAADLAMPTYRAEEEVVVRKIAETEPVQYPTAKNARYTIWPGSRCRRMPLVKDFTVQLLTDNAPEAPDLSNGLHSYLYNFSKGNAVLTWQLNGQQYSDVLAPGDSAYVQPFVNFSLHKEDTNTDTRLFVVGIPGSINMSVQREMSAFAAFDRVVSEDKCWFTA